MQKKQNPRNPRYYSFTVSRDSFVDLGKLGTIDSPASVAFPRIRSLSDYCVPNHPFQRENPLDKPINRFIKRSIDILLSIAFIIFILSWLVPVLVILVKLGSGGPVFLLRKKKKKDGQLFNCISFSTLTPAERMAIYQTGKIDRKITGIGRFMQDHCLDSLPQVVNVLMGDMSIIGPRSYKEYDALKYEKLLPGYSRRYSVKPGLTGLEQVSRHCGPVANIQKMKARTRLDLYYINQWSTVLDFKILYQSLRKMAGLGLNYSQNYSREPF